MYGSPLGVGVQNEQEPPRNQERRRISADAFLAKVLPQNLPYDFEGSVIEGDLVWVVDQDRSLNLWGYVFDGDVTVHLRDQAGVEWRNCEFNGEVTVHLSDQTSVDWSDCEFAGGLILGIEEDGKEGSDERQAVEHPGQGVSVDLSRCVLADRFEVKGPASDETGIEGESRLALDDVDVSGPVSVQDVSLTEVFFWDCQFGDTLTFHNTVVRRLDVFGSSIDGGLSVDGWLGFADISDSRIGSVEISLDGWLEDRSDLGLEPSLSFANTHVERYLRYSEERSIGLDLAWLLNPVRLIDLRECTFEGNVTIHLRDQASVTWWDCEFQRDVAINLRDQAGVEWWDCEFAGEVIIGIEEDDPEGSDERQAAEQPGQGVYVSLGGCVLADGFEVKGPASGEAGLEGESSLEFTNVDVSGPVSVQDVSLTGVSFSDCQFGDTLTFQDTVVHRLGVSGSSIGGDLTVGGWLHSADVSESRIGSVGISLDGWLEDRSDLGLGPSLSFASTHVAGDFRFTVSLGSTRPRVVGREPPDWGLDFVRVFVGGNTSLGSYSELTYMMSGSCSVVDSTLSGGLSTHSFEYIDIRDSSIGSPQGTSTSLVCTGLAGDIYLADTHVFGDVILGQHPDFSDSKALGAQAKETRYSLEDLIVEGDIVIRGVRAAYLALSDVRANRRVSLRGSELERLVLKDISAGSAVEMRDLGAKSLEAESIVASDVYMNECRGGEAALEHLTADNVVQVERYSAEGAGFDQMSMSFLRADYVALTGRTVGGDLLLHQIESRLMYIGGTEQQPFAAKELTIVDVTTTRLMMSDIEIDQRVGVTGLDCDSTLMTAVACPDIRLIDGTSRIVTRIEEVKTSELRLDGWSSQAIRVEPMRDVQVTLECRRTKCSTLDLACSAGDEDQEEESAAEYVESVADASGHHMRIDMSVFDIGANVHCSSQLSIDIRNSTFRQGLGLEEAANLLRFDAYNSDLGVLTMQGTTIHPACELNLHGVSAIDMVLRDASGRENDDALAKTLLAGPSSPDALALFAGHLKVRRKSHLYQECMLAAQRRARESLPKGIALIEWLVFDLPFRYGFSPWRLALILLSVWLTGAVVCGVHAGQFGLVSDSRWQEIVFRLGFSLSLILPFRLPIEDRIPSGLPLRFWWWMHFQIGMGWFGTMLVALTLAGYFDEVR